MTATLALACLFDEDLYRLFGCRLAGPDWSQ